MVFGKVIEGMPVVRKIEGVATSSTDVPLVDIVVTDTRVENIEPYDTVLEAVDNLEDFEEEEEDEEEEEEEAGEQ